MTKCFAIVRTVAVGFVCLVILCSPMILTLWFSWRVSDGKENHSEVGSPGEELRLTDLYQATWTTGVHKHIGIWRGENIYTDSFRYQEINGRDAAGELRYEVQAVEAANVWHDWRIQEVGDSYVLRGLKGRIEILKEDETTLVILE